MLYGLVFAIFGFFIIIFFAEAFSCNFESFG